VRNRKKDDELKGKPGRELRVRKGFYRFDHELKGQLSKKFRRLSLA
jgi:hypothetical protein